MLLHSKIVEAAGIHGFTFLSISFLALRKQVVIGSEERRYRHHAIERTRCSCSFLAACLFAETAAGAVELIL